MFTKQCEENTIISSTLLLVNGQVILKENDLNTTPITIKSIGNLFIFNKN